MRRQPALDTVNVPPASRYSYVETPIEINSSSSLQRENIGLSGSTQEVLYSQHSLAHQSTHDAPPANSIIAMNISSSGVGERVRSPHNDPPVHPAHFAPFAEGHPIQSPVASHIQPPPSPYRSPPHSPGPLPIKINPAEGPQPIPQTMVVAPDENPLKSSLSPSAVRPSFAHTWPSDNPSARSSFPQHLPGQVAGQNEIVNSRHWTTGLCSFLDIGTCCLGVTCPCILYGRTQYRLSRRSRGEDPTNMLGFELCNASCTMMACLCGLQCLLGTIQRRRIRKAYEIQGDLSSDCVRATCCLCCTLAQNEREIKCREKSRNEAAQALSSPIHSPYMPPPTMQFPPPPSARR